MPDNHPLDHVRETSRVNRRGQGTIVLGDGQDRGDGETILPGGKLFELAARLVVASEPLSGLLTTFLKKEVRYCLACASLPPSAITFS